MAYLDVTSAFPGSAPFFGAAPYAEVALPDAKGFSGLEWSIVALAANDPISSLDRPGRVARALGGLFGRGTESRLADPRLEALRRFAVHAWRGGYLMPVSEIGRFIEAGFSIDQMETLLASVAGKKDAHA